MSVKINNNINKNKQIIVHLVLLFSSKKLLPYLAAKASSVVGNWHGNLFLFLKLKIIIIVIYLCRTHRWQCWKARGLWWEQLWRRGMLLYPVRCRSWRYARAHCHAICRLHYSPKPRNSGYLRTANWAATWSVSGCVTTHRLWNCYTVVWWVIALLRPVWL